MNCVVSPALKVPLNLDLGTDEDWWQSVSGRRPGKFPGLSDCSVPQSSAA